MLGVHELASDGTAPTDSDSAPVLPTIDAADHLRLWLAAGRGVECEAGRVTYWADGSGKSQGATLASGQLGPQCGVHADAQGRDLPYFSAPKDNGNFVDETLDVDLSFLVGSEYTIFVVERRWADTGFLLGTTAPDQSSLACGSTTDTDRSLQFGYVTYPGTISLAIDHTCDGQQGPVLGTPVPPPAALTLDTARFGNGIGHQLWANGTLFFQNGTRGATLKTAEGGSIGRGLTTLTSTGIDARFVGDIAEVLIYDAALSNGDRVAIESYLEGRWGI